MLMMKKLKNGLLLGLPAAFFGSIFPLEYANTGPEYFPKRAASSCFLPHAPVGNRGKR